jgi:hypothetical protein
MEGSKMRLLALVAIATLSLTIAVGAKDPLAEIGHPATQANAGFKNIRL